MSASGKTTIGEKLYDKLLLSKEKWIFIDGDTFRNILGEDLGHTLEDRKINAYRISRFCEFLSSQNINVIACVLSLFHDNQKYNKDNIPNYKEIYIDVNFNKLIQRDNKNLYKKALNGEIKNVVGVDIKFTPPYKPDIVIDNNKDSPNYENIINSIIKELRINLNDTYEYTKNNLLHSPQKYQYSKFEGNSFFEKFFYNRKDCINYLDSRLTKLDKHGMQKIDLASNNYVNNQDLILKYFLINIYNSKDLNLHKETITILIKRFEVSKKLYLSYDLKEIRKSSLDFDELLNYSLFSIVLQKYYKQTHSEEKLIYLNAILKLNDIISSIRTEFLLYDEIYYAKKAIECELDILKEYI